MATARPVAREFPPGFVRRTALGATYVEIFKGVKTPVKWKDGEPYVTVYRGIKAGLDPEQSSAKYGDHIFTSLDRAVADRYMRSVFNWGMEGTLMRMELPLRLACVAKRASRQDPDQLFYVIDNLDYVRGEWKAEIRELERELVFKLSDLGGSLDDPRYALHVKTFKRTIPKNSDGPELKYDWELSGKRHEIKKREEALKVVVDEVKPRIMEELAKLRPEYAALERKFRAANAGVWLPYYKQELGVFLKLSVMPFRRFRAI